MRYLTSAIILALSSASLVPLWAQPPGDRPNGGSNPRWSPDGKTLAFLSASPNGPVNVWVLDAAAPQAARRLTRVGARHVGWAPDGSAVYCQTNRGGASAFHAVRTADGQETPILEFLGPDVSTVGWSQDARQVAWLQRHGDHRDLWAADVTGANARQLTEGLPVRSLAWSPDGREIAFDLTAAGGTGVLSVASAGGAEPQMLFPAFGTDPRWSPDGSRLAIVGMHALTVVNRDGTDEKRLHVSQADRSHVDWSPDGVQIAYTSATARLPGLAVVDVASDATRPLLTGWAYATTPRWSPDGASLAFEGKPRTEEGLSIGSLDVASGRARELTLSRPSDWGGQWSWKGLLYYSDDTASGRIALCRAEAGSHRPRLLLGLDPGVPHHVSWPAGASSGVVVVRNEVWRLPGASPPALLLKADHPTWAAVSPAGDRFAYVKWENGQPSIVVREMEGDRETELVPAAGEVGISRLAWSPGGTSLAYVRGDALSVTDTDGETRPLFEVPGADQPAMLFTPVWSPDGARIAIGFFTGNDGQKLRVLLLDAEVGAARVLAECAVVAEPGRLADPLGAAPAWSPDGTRLAYALERDGAPAVYVAPVEGGEAPGRPLRSAAAYPAWSADGRRLLVTLLDGERERLAEIDLGTGKTVEINLKTARPFPRPEAGGG
ncbi:MAG: hypothetical protein FJX74_03070 [Armatimonadetes bacterium]|nr:hypothetical protein [Armatimonadota bacterium]